MNRIRDEHLQRSAIVYLRQSTMAQVRNNIESLQLQYALKDRAAALGWEKIETIDSDLGISAAACGGERPGFEHLISRVALGQVGIILSREVSRLSRNDGDWCRLIEVCRVFGTLIGDESQVYDPAEMDDQLILGIKGTLSVVELSVLKLRMQQGRDASAAQGRLKFRLPSGYVHDPDDHVVKDPDQRTREAVALVFRKFRELQNGRQMFMWFHDERIEMPVYQYVGGKLRVRWRIPTQLHLVGMIKNPFYAGAYVFGRRPRQTVVIEGKLVKRTGRLLAPEQCRVFIPEHHEPYISYNEYKENVETLRENAPRRPGHEAMTAARAGRGLLVGLLRCGHCGRKLFVNYWGRSGTSPRYLCKGAYPDAGDGCISFAGTLLDKALQQQVLTAISPLGIEASLLAQQSVGETAQQRLDMLKTRAEQLHYEATRACEQYDEADPKNRLVTAELERRWNEKLAATQHAQSELDEMERRQAQLDAPSRARLEHLGEHFEQVWTSPHCSNETKKKIIRIIIEEIIVTRNEHELVFVVHWAGGVHTELRLNRPLPASHIKTATQAMDIIRILAPRYDDSAIAAVLNRHGLTTGRGNKWNKQRVLSARRRYHIKPEFHPAESLGLLSMQKAAEHCNVSHSTIRKLIAAGLVNNEQSVPIAPFAIRKADLDSPAVQNILARLRATGRLHLQGGTPIQQTSLFAQSSGDTHARSCE